MEAIEQLRHDFGSALAELRAELAPAAPRVTEIIEERKPLYEALRDWRKKEAGFRQIAAFQVLSNRMLADIANELPASTDQLAAIKGVGPDRIEKYGDAVLQIIAGYRSEW